MLDGIPTRFGKLAMVAALRIHGTSEYRHQIFERLPPGISTRLLLDTHRRLFRGWLALSLAEKIGDMADYLGLLRMSRDHKAALKADWAKFVPPSSNQTDSSAV
jgi:hypothetical protein